MTESLPVILAVLVVGLAGLGLYVWYCIHRITVNR